MALINCSITYTELNKIAGQPIGSQNARLIISPNNGYVVSASNFSNNSGIIPGVSAISISNSSVPNTQSNLVYVDVNLDDSYIMPSNNTDIVIDIDGSATLLPVTVSGLYSTILSNSGSSQTNVAYSGSGSFGQTVQLFTKTIQANTGYYFENAPVYSIISGNANNYTITSTDNFDALNRLISRTFTVSYNIQLQNEQNHRIEFRAAAKQIYVAPVDITAYTFSTTPIPLTGDTRQIRVFGAPGAVFNVNVVDQGNVSIASVSGQAVDSSGYYDMQVTFPSSAITKSYTMLLTGNLSSSFNTPQGQPSTVTVWQYADVSLAILPTHSDSSVVFTSNNNVRTLTPNVDIDPSNFAFSGSFELSSANILSFTGQPNLSMFTNTDFNTNGGTDFDIVSASITTSSIPNNITFSFLANVYRGGISNVVSNIDISSILTVTVPHVCDLTVTNVSTTSTNSIGGSDGTATITFSGTGGQVNYSINGNSAGVAQSPLLINGLASGTYSVSFIDSFGCTAATEVVINEYVHVCDLSVSSVSTTNPTNINNDNGTATISFTGTGGACTYTLDSVPMGTVTSPFTISNLLPNQTYNVVITDSFNCTAATNFVLGAFSFDADYLLVTYEFTDGSDLDTVSRIVSPDIGQNTLADTVGYNKLSQFPATNPYIVWGSDNQGTGFESVLINLALLKQNYTSSSELLADFRGHWYGTIGVQPVNVAATLWRGGTPVKTTYAWTNPTAEAVFNIDSAAKTISRKYQAAPLPSPGERIATLRYNWITGTGVIDANDTTTPSI